jgi:glycosyltransferase involved in cell wall biosynthesis
MNHSLNIVLLSAVYPPEPQVSARISFDLANYLASKNHNVTVVCPRPSRPLLADYSSYKNLSAPIIKIEGNIKVVRLNSFVYPKSGIGGRLRESLSFGRLSIDYLSKEIDQPDVIYVNTWPLIAQAIIAKYARQKSIPMVLQIMDIYPEAFTNRLPIFLRYIVNFFAKRLDARTARTANKVVVISENMRLTYLKNRKIHDKFIIKVYTWQDENLFKDVKIRTVCCQKYGIPIQPFTFLFLGNIGRVAGVEFLISSFAAAGLTNSQLLVIGDGVSRNECIKLAKKMNLANVRFISDPESGNVPELQGMAHVCLLPMKRGTGMSSIPSKLMSYLFSAKPVIVTADFSSDTANFVNQAKCGWVGEAENCKWLAQTLSDVSKLSMEQLDCIGSRGREFGLKYFAKSVGVVKLSNTIINTANYKHDS